MCTKTYICYMITCFYFRMDYGYRLLRDDENPLIGLKAKNPLATKSVLDHVANGSQGGYESQFISTSTNWNWIHTFVQKTKGTLIRIVRIDLTLLRNTGAQIYDTPMVLQLCSSDIKAYNYAKWASEVLVVGIIPPECLEMFEVQKNDFLLNVLTPIL